MIIKCQFGGCCYGIPQTYFKWFVWPFLDQLHTQVFTSENFKDTYEKLRDSVVQRTEEYLASKGYPEIKVSFVNENYSFSGNNPFELKLSGNTSQLTHFKLKYL